MWPLLTDFLHLGALRPLDKRKSACYRFWAGVTGRETLICDVDFLRPS